MYKNVTYLFAGFMVVMCLVMSYYLVFTDILIEKLYGFKRHLFVALMLIYGAYRTFRLYSIIQKDRRDKNS